VTLFRDQFYILYHEINNGGKECWGFYHKNEKKNLYLRYSVLHIGNLTAFVSSNHSLEELIKLLSKPKPLWINRCCGFKVQQTKFQLISSIGKSNFQISHDKGKTYIDYEIGANKEIDNVFNNAKELESEENNFFVVDFAEILEPHFQIIKAKKNHNF